MTLPWKGAQGNLCEPPWHSDKGGLCDSLDTGSEKAGYQVLVLSNFSDKVRRENGDALDFLEYVDGGILSYKDGVIKPDPAIYSLLLERYGLKPEECVFLDDMQPNLDAAAWFGIHTILFRSYEEAQEELKKLGVEA